MASGNCLTIRHTAKAHQKKAFYEFLIATEHKQRETAWGGNELKYLVSMMETDPIAPASDFQFPFSQYTLQ